MSTTELSNMKQPPVPLATLIGQELRNGKIEKPFVKYGQAGLAKKGEDYFLIKTDCQRVPGDSSTLFSVFAVLFMFLVYIYDCIKMISILLLLVKCLGIDIRIIRDEKIALDKTNR